MKIGSVNINGNLFLAPMSNVTSLPFRLLCKRYGAAMVYSEMINADAFIMDSEKTMKRAYFLDGERPVGIQLSGSKAEILVKAIKKIENELNPDIIDINIGCPAYQVMRNGCGASLLEDKVKLRVIVEKLASSISAPLTCKIRITGSEKNTLEIAKIIEKSGAKAISVHGRTAKQGYSGMADWDIIKKIKGAAKIPIILNGDVTNEVSAKNAFEITGCDAVMIGRAAIGNPYLFKRINYYLKTGNMLPERNISETIEDFTEIISMCRKYDYIDIKSIKMFAQNSIKGFAGCNDIKRGVTECKDINSIESLLKSYTLGARPQPDLRT